MSSSTLVWVQGRPRSSLRTLLQLSPPPRASSSVLELEISILRPSRADLRPSLRPSEPTPEWSTSSLTRVRSSRLTELTQPPSWPSASQTTAQSSSGRPPSTVSFISLPRLASLISLLTHTLLCDCRQGRNQLSPHARTLLARLQASPSLPRARTQLRETVEQGVRCGRHGWDAELDGEELARRTRWTGGTRECDGNRRGRERASQGDGAARGGGTNLGCCVGKGRVDRLGERSGGFYLAS